jgi:hypothetical protein
MNLVEVMTNLYKMEINCGMQSFGDDGFKVWVGDDMNENKSEKYFTPEELDTAAGHWLNNQAQIFYLEIQANALRD